jgi:hypothetical protein
MRLGDIIVAALPPDNTARYKVFYTFAGNTHVVQVRATGVHSPSSFGTWFDGLMTELDNSLYPVTISKVEFAASGSNVFNTVVTGIESNTYGSGTPVGLLAPQFIGFQGRTSGGHKVRLSIYGIKPEENDYRFEPADNADVDDAITYLQTTSAFAKGIDGVTPNWYSYANTGFNAYWQRKNR